ncbi:unnamed protein product [Acanthoscelides obtectus]|uniref:FYVE-type domain-containing protein n=1 Tax=Acanthoscelides obtectus TaxID=200917 RepID=A0A9P0LIV3_ACAOB|nr:unnamed protein product [Acanthoscelides obtectus]CAK1640330.1 Zinc finger FYVE domain-containing protein 9 [Acanthoscelides obtectus]
MEKFAIDLDQVLNDFEYKELTDQYTSKNVPESRASSTTNQTEKHTINNVFHSLNEYLNTSVKITRLEPSDNNLTNEIDSQLPCSPSCSVGPRYSHTQEDTKLISDVSDEGQNCDLDNENVQDFLVGSENVEIEAVVPKTEDEIVVKDVKLCDVVTGYTVLNTEDKQVVLREPHYPNNQNTSNSERNEICYENAELENENLSAGNPDTGITNLKPDEPNTIDNQTIKEEILANISQEDLEAQIAEEKSKVKSIEAELIAEIGNKIPGHTLSQVPQVTSKIGFDTNLDLDDKEISKLLDELEEDEDLSEFGLQKNMAIQAECHKEDAIQQKVEQTNPFEEQDSESRDETVPSVEANINLSYDEKSSSLEPTVDTEAKNEGTHTISKTDRDTNSGNTEVTIKNTENAECEKSIACGFKENTTIEDSICTENCGNKIVSVRECAIDDSKIPVSQEHMETTENVEEKESSTSDIDATRSIQHSAEPAINNEGLHENSAVKDADSNVVGSEIVDDERITASVGDVLIKPNEDFTLVASEEMQTVIKIEDEDSTKEKLETNDHEISQSNDRKLINQESSSLEKDNSQDSLTRPQNLPLKDSEDIKRNIDLIGGPGSTPYNNVYIDKEIEQTMHDSDTDSSTSSSPSFSDTNSVSTASTEEIQDDDLPINRNPFENPSKPDHNEISVGVVESCPTESVERENVTNSDNPVTSQSTSLTSGDIASGVSSREEDKPNPSAIPSDKCWLGKEAPLWVPDSDALACLHCDMKFTVLKRRHHCRACGLVLCSKCCHLRFRLEYLDGEGRVCNKCHDILNMRDLTSGGGEGSAVAITPGSPAGDSSSSGGSPESSAGDSRRPNPNNPLEYCSTVSPLQQAAAGGAGRSGVAQPPAVMVPIGVLKRKGSNKGKSNKSVMFCDGIRPGSDLTNLDNDFNYNNTKTKKLEKNSTSACAGKINRHLPIIDSQTNSFIPSNENNLPPTVTFCKTEITYTECSNAPALIETLKKDQLTFAIHINLYVHLKLINMSCCINKWAWCFSTEGLINVGQDEVVYLIEYINAEVTVPKDIFHHISGLYCDAVKGNSVSELGVSLHNSPNFLDSKNHAGFVYIRPTFQCMENVIKPKDPYVIGILIHRWETPWAKLFPLRLVLRLGAEYRYYPSPIISTRNRDSVFVEIGHTIINLLADFRNFSYSLPQIRGLTIHMEDKNTTVSIPVNRYDQVVKSLNNSSDHILAFAGNFSSQADSHLVCIQDTQGNEDCYSTHAINIQNKPRKITGASFIVFNGALKSTSGLTAKSNIVEDGLMIQDV